MLQYKKRSIQSHGVPTSSFLIRHRRFPPGPHRRTRLAVLLSHSASPLAVPLPHSATPLTAVITIHHVPPDPPGRVLGACVINTRHRLERHLRHGLIVLVKVVVV